MITCVQIKMARTGLGWTGKKLSEESGVGLSTIKRLEQDDSFSSVSIQKVQAIEKAFLATGRVTFEGETGVSVDPEE